MVIAQIEGGLGSQMFGYAAARRLAIAHGTEVFIDTRNFRTYKKFQPELHHFDVDASLLPDDQTDQICGVDNSLVRVVEPKHLWFDHSVLEIEDPHVLMRGNYIGEDYFFDVVDTIRRDFTRVSQPTPYGADTQGMIGDLKVRGYEPVAVHIRRGDYVNEADVLAVHGICSLEYYDLAFSLVNRLVENPWYVFFSDDIDWVMANFPGDNRSFARPPANTPPIEDMMSMAACTHHIIANSGYSWWGAWLTDEPDHVVIGPRPILADRSLNSEERMLRHWISLGNTPRPRVSART